MQQTLTQVTLIQDRARLFGLFGTVVGVSSIVGPLVGGYLHHLLSFALLLNEILGHLQITSLGAGASLYVLSTNSLTWTNSSSERSIYPLAVSHSWL